VLVLAPTREVALQSCDVIERVAAALPAPAPSSAAFVGGLPTADDQKRLRRCGAALATRSCVDRQLTTQLRATPASAPPQGQRVGRGEKEARSPSSPAVCAGTLPTSSLTSRLVFAAPTRRTCHIVVGTPGRVCALASSGSLPLRTLRCLVLDEADQLLGDGFHSDVAWLHGSLPSRKQARPAMRGETKRPGRAPLGC
jgi:superfamily II DNA/RNA helicase